MTSEADEIEGCVREGLRARKRRNEKVGMFLLRKFEGERGEDALALYVKISLK
jgi:hypothetical protein